MKAYSPRLIWTLLAALLLAACGPVPGGSLSGTLTRVPKDWPSLLEDGHAICEIESRPSEPHSIQLECFSHGQGIYVQSHRWALKSWWPVESWAAIWIQNPTIRLRIGRQIFELQAEHVSSPAERTEVLELRGYDPIPEGIAVFRFVPRT